MTIFIADVVLKDAAVNLTYLHYRENMRIRKINGFRDKEILENCLENRIRNVMAYGLYFYKLTSGDFSDTKKMLMIK